MMPASVLAYYQLGQFLMLVMVFSWLFSTFGFLSICSVIGPKDDFGQLNCCSSCKNEPEEETGNLAIPDLDKSPHDQNNKGITTTPL